MDSDADSSKMHGEVQSLNSSFFETLWPLILDENKCHLESKSADYFVPRKPFDYLYWHTMLSKVGFPHYVQPHDLRCCEAAKRQDESEEQAVQAANEAALREGPAALADYEPAGSLTIRPVDKQVAHLREKQERRQKLAYDFGNRKRPWTMQTETHDQCYTFTSEMRLQFQPTMENKILDAIQQYNCKLLVIDAGTEVCADDFQRWIKFRPYAQMLALVRCPRVQRHLQLLNVFNTLLVEENIQNSWHQELQCSLRAGLEEAKRLGLLTSCAETFVFIFSRYHGLCTCDTFSILRRI